MAIWASTHAFIMMRLNSDAAPMPYYVIRRLNGDMNARVKEIRLLYPNSIMVYQQRSSPNAINLYKRLKATGMINTKANYCKLRRGNEFDLIEMLGKLVGNIVTVLKPMRR